MDIFLIRHGQSTGNGRRCFMGWSDHPLTELGRAQARAVAERLAARGPLPVVCSDLLRTRETAELIAARWHGEIQPDARWREVHCGQFEDRPWDEFSALPELSAQFDADPLGAVMPGGESVAMMIARVTEAFIALLACSDAGIIIVTHDGPIRAVLAHCLHIPPERFWTLTTDHCGLTHLSVNEQWISIRTINDTSHLAGNAECGV